MSCSAAARHCRWRCHREYHGMRRTVQPLIRPARDHAALSIQGASCYVQGDGLEDQRWCPAVGVAWLCPKLHCTNITSTTQLAESTRWAGYRAAQQLLQHPQQSVNNAQSQCIVLPETEAPVPLQGQRPGNALHATGRIHRRLRLNV